MRAGDQVFIGPAVGVHGYREPWWLLVVGTRTAMVAGFLYIRGVPVDDIEGGRVRTFYVQTRHLQVRRSD